MNIDKKANQAEFEALLRSVNRDGMDYVIEDLEKDGFFLTSSLFQNMFVSA
ncbi:MAG: hypothetical protein ACLUV4_04570 [Prevotella sp.]